MPPRGSDQFPGPDASSTFTQTYTAKVTLAPLIAGLKVSFSVDEALALDVLESPALVVSKAGSGLEVLLLPFLSTRYRLDWEWDSQTAPGAASGSAYRNAFGLTASGKELPFSFAAEYALSFGFRGLRHDVTASVTAPFRGGFGLQGSLTLSEYESGGAPTTPFLAIFSASYES